VAALACHFGYERTCLAFTKDEEEHAYPQDAAFQLLAYRFPAAFL